MMDLFLQILETLLLLGSNQVEGIRKEPIEVSAFSYTIMRKDPPVESDYINALAPY